MSISRRAFVWGTAATALAGPAFAATANKPADTGLRAQYELDTDGILTRTVTVDPDRILDKTVHDQVAKIFTHLFTPSRMGWKKTLKIESTVTRDSKPPYAPVFNDREGTVTATVISPDGMERHRYTNIAGNDEYGYGTVVGSNPREFDPVGFQDVTPGDAGHTYHVSQKVDDDHWRATGQGGGDLNKSYAIHLGGAGPRVIQVYDAHPLIALANSLVPFTGVQSLPADYVQYFGAGGHRLALDAYCAESSTDDQPPKICQAPAAPALKPKTAPKNTVQPH